MAPSNEARSALKQMRLGRWSWEKMIKASCQLPLFALVQLLQNPNNQNNWATLYREVMDSFWGVSYVLFKYFGAVFKDFGKPNNTAKNTFFDSFCCFGHLHQVYLPTKIDSFESFWEGSPTHKEGPLGPNKLFHTTWVHEWWVNPMKTPKSNGFQVCCFIAAGLTQPHMLSVAPHSCRRWVGAHTETSQWISPTTTVTCGAFALSKGWERGFTFFFLRLWLSGW